VSDIVSLSSRIYVDVIFALSSFQAAPSAPTASTKQPSIAPAANKSSQKVNVFDFLSDGGDSVAPSAAAPRPAFATTTLSPSVAPLQPQRTVSSNSTTTSSSKVSNGNGAATSSLNFDDLWATSAGKSSSSAAGANKGKMSMAEMAKQKSSSAVWGAQTPQAKQSDPFDFL
jgi:epsin